MTEENFLCEAALKGAAVLQGGMGSGKSAIGFNIQMPDGKYVMVQTSAEILQGLMSVVKGAEERWEAERIAGN